MKRKGKKIQKLREDLFFCNKCIGCDVRNEDLLGSYKTKIIFIGINPHINKNTKRWFEKLLENKNINEWIERNENYFKNRESKDYHKYFNKIEKKLEIEFGKNSSNIDLYKIGTSDENELNKKIKNDKKIRECPKTYLFRQIDIIKPKLIICSGAKPRNFFIKNKILKGTLGKVSEEPMKFAQGTINDINYKFLFLPSFSNRVSRYWMNIKERSLKKKIKEEVGS